MAFSLDECVSLNVLSFIKDLIVIFYITKELVMLPSINCNIFGEDSAHVDFCSYFSYHGDKLL